MPQIHEQTLLVLFSNLISRSPSLLPSSLGLLGLSQYHPLPRGPQQSPRLPVPGLPTSQSLPSSPCTGLRPVPSLTSTPPPCSRTSLLLALYQIWNECPSVSPKDKRGKCQQSRVVVNSLWGHGCKNLDPVITGLRDKEHVTGWLTPVCSQVIYVASAHLSCVRSGLPRGVGRPPRHFQ